VIKSAEGSSPVAVVDIGSNSVRLVVYNGKKRSAMPVFNEKVACGLGRGLAKNNRLNDEAVERTLIALMRFRAISRHLKADRMHVIATAAARDAKNGAKFITWAEDACGSPITVLSGQDEAQMAANGVIAGMYKIDGLAGDMGGGSLELIDINNGRLVGGETLPLGGLRMIDETDGNIKKANRFAASNLDKIGWLTKGKGRPFYAVGGTWRAFARLHMRQTSYPLRVIHGYTISASDALKFAHLLDHVPVDELDGAEKFSKARREVIPYGAVALAEVIRRTNPSQIVFSAYGVREGVLYSILGKKEQARDPLLSACSELARLRSRSSLHAQQLCDWTDRIFTSPQLKEGKKQRRLRHAACLLSDIGWRAHPDYRGEQSSSAIAHGTFPGLDHRGRAYLALTACIRHYGPEGGNQCPEILGLLSEKYITHARILGAAIRTAHALSASMPGIINQTEVVYRNGNMELHIPANMQVFIGEQLEKDLKKLAAELNMGGKIEVVDKP
jgi:exopolyphosphatase/guanosine-5'-triphosphate,3'-diphosphate pyrophosphatase